MSDKDKDEWISDINNLSIQHAKSGNSTASAITTLAVCIIEVGGNIVAVMEKLAKENKDV